MNYLEMSKISGFVDRARGTGRPDQKDRREVWRNLQLRSLWMILTLISILKNRINRKR